MTSETQPSAPSRTAKYSGIPITTNGNQLVAYFTEARLADAGVFYPITPSTEQGENFELSFAKGELNVFGHPKIAIEAEGEHAAQGGAIAVSLLGKRVANFTSGQGIVYGLEQYYHAPGKLSTMVLEVAARALTKHALNVHCGHDDVYSALDTGWTVLFAKDAQQAADQSLILRKVNELCLTPGMNCQDGFLTSHVERTFLKPEAGLIREFLGRADDVIDCPTEAQRQLFGPRRRRVPHCLDLRSPVMLGTVQNQEHYMQGVAARRHHFVEHILSTLEEAYEEFGRLTGRYYGHISCTNVEKADTVFVSLGSSAENIEAAIDYIRERRQEEVGVVHVNVLRPFPEEALVQALAGKKNVIVLERTDEQGSGDNPLTRDVRTALSKANENCRTLAHAHLPALAAEETPRVFSGVYGLGSRDFRPEHILGAHEFAVHGRARQDGKTADDGSHFFYLGINHPYAVVSEDTPSLLPEKAISVRFHSIGGWGMITTGKNLGEVLGGLGRYVTTRDHPEMGPGESVVHISANPKYGSEKKGAPTNYFLVVADERIRVNCDLRHVDVVLCCDPRVFLHTNPLSGLKPGGAFVWQTDETDDRTVWERIPPTYRQEIIDKNIRLLALDGFAIAKAATPRADLQYRMQGNAFLGGFFRVSSFLKDFEIPDEEFLQTVHAQYEKKFGRFGKAVVASNMTVMQEGFSQVREIPHFPVEADDRSSMRGHVFVPLCDHQSNGETSTLPTLKCESPLLTTSTLPAPTLCSLSHYDEEFRGDYGYDTPSSPRASTGAMAAATGATSSKYVARRETPKFIAENCTQCMACITSCPDTALPNTAQNVDTVLRTLFNSYVAAPTLRKRLLSAVPTLDETVREKMKAEAAKKKDAEVAPLAELIIEEVQGVLENDPECRADSALQETLEKLRTVVPKLPLAYARVNAIFKAKEKKEPGSGGIFSIFVNDLCKGCAECVEECGDHNALVMVAETEEVNADHETGTEFLKMLPSTPRQFLGKFDPDNPLESRDAVLQNHLMVQNNYSALVSGDGACAGCGEKTLLRAVVTLTESMMRPLYHEKADRLENLASDLSAKGITILQNLRKTDEEGYRLLRKAVIHLILGLGGEDDADTDHLIRDQFHGSDELLIDTLEQVLRVDAFNHRDLSTIEGGNWNGMSVMAMAASTGCNTVYGSTHPNNPHPYPWVNSLFQDGATVGWLLAEGFIVNHARRSVLPERIARRVLGGSGLTEEEYWQYTHFTDSLMSDRELLELPKVWAIGGDGGFGDIGFQNLSKAVLQNRPNLKILLLDTQVYSNTGGQNSDSSPMPGGFDMNQLGKGSEGKLTEKKSVAEILTVGHGSPHVAQVSMANVASLYRSVLDGLAYRGTSFIQGFSTCQPEHGVGDNLSTLQAKRIRDSRGMPEFIFDPQLGESYEECLSIKGNPQSNRDWWTSKQKGYKSAFQYTVAHWAHTEARFRRHFHKVTAEDTERLPFLEDVLWRITQDDVIHRRYLDPKHRSYVPEEGSWIEVLGASGEAEPIGISRQVVLFAVERRKAWRLLQSRAGVQNLDRMAQFRVLREYDSGDIPKEILESRMNELLETARKMESAGEKGSVLEALVLSSAEHSSGNGTQPATAT